MGEVSTLPVWSCVRGDWGKAATSKPSVSSSSTNLTLKYSQVLQKLFQNLYRHLSTRPSLHACQGLMLLRSSCPYHHPSSPPVAEPSWRDSSHLCPLHRSSPLRLSLRGH